MKASLIVSVIAVITVPISFVLGMSAGEMRQKNGFEVAKASATLRAQEALDTGSLDKAMALSHFAKAYERIEGSTDDLLATVYQQKKRYCIAEGFFESNLEYVQRNRLEL